jgi:hypothetical protein
MRGSVAASLGGRAAIGSSRYSLTASSLIGAEAQKYPNVLLRGITSPRNAFRKLAYGDLGRVGRSQARRNRLSLAGHLLFDLDSSKTTQGDRPRPGSSRAGSPGDPLRFSRHSLLNLRRKVQFLVSAGEASGDLTRPE